MTRKKTIAIIIFAALAALTTMAPALTGFEGEGWAPITENDINPARRLALKRALQQSVEEAAGALLPRKVFAEKYDEIEKKVLNNYNTYIADYTVIAESKDGNRYHVVAQANVRVDRLREDLVKLGMMLPESNIPNWIVILPDRVDEEKWRSIWFLGGGGKSPSEGAVEDIIRNYGFRVVARGPGSGSLSDDMLKAVVQSMAPADLDMVELPAGLVQFAKERGATHMIVGTGQARRSEGIDGPPYMLGTAELKVVAVDVSTGSIIGAFSKRAAAQTFGDTGLDSRVLRMAVRKMEPDLIKTFDSANPAGSAAGFPVITIVLSGVTSFDQFSTIEKFLEEEVRGVRSVIIAKLAPGEVVLDVKFAGEAQTLITELTKKDFGLFSVSEESVEDGVHKLSIK